MAFNRYTDGGIAYEEIEGSPTFSANREGLTAKQIYLVAAGDGLKLIEESFPAAIDGLTIGGVGTWSFANSRAMPGIPALRTESIEVEPFDANNPGNTGTDYNLYPAGERVTISYSTNANFEPEDGGDGTELMKHSVQLGGEFLQIPASGCRWSGMPAGDNAQEEDLQVGKMIPTIEHQLSFNYVPSLPASTIASKIGKVNSDTVLFGAPAETLLFVGADAEQSYTTDGAETWRIDYRFSQRVVYDGGGGPYGWNHFYRPSTGTWDILLTKDGNSVYDSTTFTALFRP